MTYGWAILAVLVVLGVLFFSSGLTDTTLFLPEECEFYISVICFDYLVKQDEIQLSIVNAAGRAMIVKNIIATSDALEGQCELALDHRGENLRGLPLKDGEKFLFNLNVTTRSSANFEASEDTSNNWNFLSNSILAASAQGESNTDPDEIFPHHYYGLPEILGELGRGVYSNIRKPEGRGMFSGYHVGFVIGDTDLYFNVPARADPRLEKLRVEVTSDSPAYPGPSRECETDPINALTLSTFCRDRTNTGYQYNPDNLMPDGPGPGTHDEPYGYESLRIPDDSSNHGKYVVDYPDGGIVDHWTTGESNGFIGVARGSKTQTCDTTTPCSIDFVLRLPNRFLGFRYSAQSDHIHDRAVFLSPIEITVIAEDSAGNEIGIQTYKVISIHPVNDPDRPTSSLRRADFIRVYDIPNSKPTVAFGVDQDTSLPDHIKVIRPNPNVLGSTTNVNVQILPPSLDGNGDGSTTIPLTTDIQDLDNNIQTIQIDIEIDGTTETLIISTDPDTHNLPGNGVVLLQEGITFSIDTSSGTNTCYDQIDNALPDQPPISGGACSQPFSITLPPGIPGDSVVIKITATDSNNEESEPVTPITINPIYSPAFGIITVKKDGVDIFVVEDTQTEVEPGDILTINVAAQDLNGDLATISISSGQSGINFVPSSSVDVSSHSCGDISAWCAGSFTVEIHDTFLGSQITLELTATDTHPTPRMTTELIMIAVTQSPRINNPPELVVRALKGRSNIFDAYETQLLDIRPGNIINVEVESYDTDDDLSTLSISSRQSGITFLPSSSVDVYGQGCHTASNPCSAVFTVQIERSFDVNLGPLRLTVTASDTIDDTREDVAFYITPPIPPSIEIKRIDSTLNAQEMGHLIELQSGSDTQVRLLVEFTDSDGNLDMTKRHISLPALNINDGAFSFTCDPPLQGQSPGFYTCKAEYDFPVPSDFNKNQIQVIATVEDANGNMAAKNALFVVGKQGCQHVDLGTKRNSYDLKLIYAWKNSPNINHVITGKLVATSPD